MIVQRSPSGGSKLGVTFSDGSQPATTLDSLMSRVADWTDFFATSVGDLDRLYDANGDYHDEVVVAWAEAPANRNNDMQLHVAVLNYNSDASPTVTTTSTNLGVGGGTYNSIVEFDRTNFSGSAAP